MQTTVGMKILLLPLLIAVVLSAPSSKDLPVSYSRVLDVLRDAALEDASPLSKLEGCWYEGVKYQEGVEVPTREPCLNCTCNGKNLVCFLRMCPRSSLDVPDGCYKVRKQGRCCEELVCGSLEEEWHSLRNEFDPGSSHTVNSLSLNEQTASSLDLANSSHDVSQPVNGSRGCYMDGALFAEGSAMESPDACSYCFCIRGRKECVSPKCILPLEGCKPRYRSFSCCPTYYECHAGGIEEVDSGKRTPEVPLRTKPGRRFQGTQTSGSPSGTKHDAEGVQRPLEAGWRKFQQRRRLRTTSESPTEARTTSAPEGTLPSTTKDKSFTEEKPSEIHRRRFIQFRNRNRPSSFRTTTMTTTSTTTTATDKQLLDRRTTEDVEQNEPRVASNEGISPQIPSETARPEESTTGKSEGPEKGLEDSGMQAPDSLGRKETEDEPAEESEPKSHDSAPVGYVAEDSSITPKTKLDNLPITNMSDAVSVLDILRKRIAQGKRPVPSRLFPKQKFNRPKPYTPLKHEDSAVTVEEESQTKEKTPSKGSLWSRFRGKLGEAQKGHLATFTTPSTITKESGKHRTPSTSFTNVKSISTQEKDQEEKVQTTKRPLLEVTSSRSSLWNKFRLKQGANRRRPTPTPEPSSSAPKTQKDPAVVEQTVSTGIRVGPIKKKPTSIKSTGNVGETSITKVEEIVEHQEVTNSEVSQTQHEEQTVVSSEISEHRKVTPESSRGSLFALFRNRLTPKWRTTTSSTVSVATTEVDTKKNASTNDRQESAELAQHKKTDTADQPITEAKRDQEIAESRGGHGVVSTLEEAASVTLKESNNRLDRKRHPGPEEDHADEAETVTEHEELDLDVTEDAAIEHSMKEPTEESEARSSDANSRPTIAEKFSDGGEAEIATQQKGLVLDTTEESDSLLRQEINDSDATERNIDNNEDEEEEENMTTASPEREKEEDEKEEITKNLSPDKLKEEDEEKSGINPETITGIGTAYAIPEEEVVPSSVQIGTGIYIKESGNTFEKFGPVELYGNSVRHERQNKMNETEEEVMTEEPTQLTTTILEEEAVPEPELPSQDPEPELPLPELDTVPATEEPLETEAEVKDESVFGDQDNPFTDVFTLFRDRLPEEIKNLDNAGETIDITVSSPPFMANEKGEIPAMVGIGEVIPVGLEPEHRTAGVTLPPPTVTSIRPPVITTPSLLTSLLTLISGASHSDSHFDLLLPRPIMVSETNPEKEKEFGVPETGLSEKVEAPPLRVRPRPHGVEADLHPPFLRPPPRPQPHPPMRPEFIPPRIRPPPPPPPTSDHHSGMVVSSLLNVKPDLTPPSPLFGLLPSDPIIESGFQGIRDEDKNNDTMDSQESNQPTLPPSSPDLDIIPFVAADAVLGSSSTTDEEDFRSTEKPSIEKKDEEAPESEDESAPAPKAPSRIKLTPPKPGSLRFTSKGTTEASTTSYRPFPFRFRTKPPVIRTPSPIEEETEDAQEEEKTKVSSIISTKRPFRIRDPNKLRPHVIPPRRPSTKFVPPAASEIPLHPLPPVFKVEHDTHSVNEKDEIVPLDKPLLHLPILHDISSISDINDDVHHVSIQDISEIPNNKLSLQPHFSINKPSVKEVEKQFPEIPDFVKNQFPIGNEPIGPFKLAGCNVYGRVFNVGDEISELAEGCKVCRCTHIGVQCLMSC